MMMREQMERRLGALEAQQGSSEQLGVVIIPNSLPEGEREAWVAARAALLPPGNGFVVIPEKSRPEGGEDI